MGNIPFSLNCFCPVDEKNNLEVRIAKLEDNDSRNVERFTNLNIKLESNINKLNTKVSRIEDKIDMRFEMLFLKLKD